MWYELWRVTTSTFSAAFWCGGDGLLIRDAKFCSPILRKYSSWQEIVGRFGIYAMESVTMIRRPPTREIDAGGGLGTIQRIDGQRILCAGSRHWSDREMIYNALIRYHEKQFIDYIIEGEAHGADKLSAEIAHSLGIPVMDFPAMWDVYGRSAGPIRNQQMIDNGMPTCALLFHDDITHSRGTRDMMLRLQKHHIPFEIIHH